MNQVKPLPKTLSDYLARRATAPRPGHPPRWGGLRTIYDVELDTWSIKQITGHCSHPKVAPADPTPARHAPTPEELKSLILSRIRVDRQTECWRWQGIHLKPSQANPATRPYGQVWICVEDPTGTLRYKGLLVHRLAYELWVGPIPEGREICHITTCPHFDCCNPGHLYAGTHAQNMRDAAAQGKMGRHGKALIKGTYAYVPADPLPGQKIKPIYFLPGTEPAGWVRTYNSLFDEYNRARQGELTPERVKEMFPIWVKAGIIRVPPYRYKRGNQFKDAQELIALGQRSRDKR